MASEYNKGCCFCCRNKRDYNDSVGGEAIPEDPIKLLMFMVKHDTERRVIEHRRGTNFSQMMNHLTNFSKSHILGHEVLIRLRKIMRKENSFLYGFCEVISRNIDYVFRYLYAVAFILLMAG